MKNKIIKSNGKKFILTFLDKNNKPCEEKDAYMVSISEYDENDKFIQSTIGYVKNKTK